MTLLPEHVVNRLVGKQTCPTEIRARGWYLNTRETASVFRTRCTWGLKGLILARKPALRQETPGLDWSVKTLEKGMDTHPLY